MLFLKHLKMLNLLSTKKLLSNASCAPIGLDSLYLWPLVLAVVLSAYKSPKLIFTLSCYAVSLVYNQRNNNNNNNNRQICITP